MIRYVFFAISLGTNLQALPNTATHPDETRWLNRAYYARELADPFGPTWQDYVTTRGQPPLGSIVMGVGLMVQGKAVDIGGYFQPDQAKLDAVMRPSATLNSALATMQG